MDKKDERVFVKDIKGQLMQPGDRVIRGNTKDRALFFIISGKFFTQDDTSYPEHGPVYKTGSVLGVDQFLNDDKWAYDLICYEEGIVAKYEYASYINVKAAAPGVSSKFYNRIIRHKCYEMLEAQKEKKSEYLTD